MGILKRLRDVTVASVHEVLDSLEDPVMMLSQYIRDMEAEIARLEVTVARHIAMEKSYYHQWQEAQDMAEKRERQLNLALAEGEDDIARRALIDKKYYEARAAEYRELYQTARNTAQELREKLAECKDQFYRMRAEKYKLMSRAHIAQTKKQLNQLAAGFGLDSALRGFARMEEKVMQMEMEAELSGQGREKLAGFPPRLVDEIDAELAERKARLAKEYGKSDPHPDDSTNQPS